MSLPINQPSPELEWERWHLKEDPRRLVRLSLLALLVVLVGAVLVVSLPIMAAVALGLALVVALLPYLMPRRFLLGQQGLSIRQGFYVILREWSEFDGCQPVKGGYLLNLRPVSRPKSPRPNLLSPSFKELFLPLPLEPEKVPLLAILLENYIP
jgi:hypothetical protein